MQQAELTNHEGYELFRRAIVERSSDAWASIYRQYRPIILGWSRQYCAKSWIAELPEDIADRAVSRAWLALTPGHFETFNNLPALLGYFRQCVLAAVIDASRAAATRERAYRRLEARPVVTPEQAVVGSAARMALWRLLFRMITSEQEQVVLVATSLLALAPRQIYARHQHLFANVGAVYAVKRNLFSRLQRSRELRQIYEELRD